MGRGSYFGGSTVVGLGRAFWYDHPEDRDPAVGKVKAKQAKLKVKPKTAESPATAKPAALKKYSHGLMVPLTQAHLIASIMSDLGRPIPMRVKPMNKAIGKLIRDGVVTERGELNRTHPLLQLWLSRLERKAASNPRA